MLISPLLAFSLAVLMAVTPVEVARPAIDEAISDECENLADALDADWCAYQFTDIEVSDSGRSATTRAQFSVGCSDDAIEAVQEAEYLVTVSIANREVVQAVWIESAHLPGGGVREFVRAYCPGYAV